jgi:hypothetical protein
MPVALMAVADRALPLSSIASVHSGAGRGGCVMDACTPLCLLGVIVDLGRSHAVVT